jgi:hypothetical protein
VSRSIWGARAGRDREGQRRTEKDRAGQSRTNLEPGSSAACYSVLDAFAQLELRGNWNSSEHRQIKLLSLVTNIPNIMEASPGSNLLGKAEGPSAISFFPVFAASFN